MIKKSLMNLVQSNQIMQLVLLLQEADKSLLMKEMEGAIKLATEYGYTTTLSILLVFHRSHAQAAFPISAYNQWLQIATERGHIDTIDLLIYFGADINEILPQLRSCAEQGDDANALYIMGGLQRKGYEPAIRKDLLAAKENFKKAVEKGHRQAILALGYIHRDEGNFSQARYCFDQLLKHQSLLGDAYCALGHMRQIGEGCDVDCKIAEDDYQRAIRSGSQKAKVFLGQIVYQDQSKQKQAEAVRLWQDAAWEGDMDACWELMQSLGKKDRNQFRTLAYCYSLLLKVDDQLGIGKSVGRLGWMHEHECYVRSEGEQINHAVKAYESYKKAVELRQDEYKSHLARAAYDLAMMYENGIDVIKNHKKAKALFQEAAQYGSGKSACCIGEICESGINANNNKDEAERYYQMAIDLGDTEAAYNLKQLHDSHIVNEEKIACQRLEQAAKQGNADAQNKLGERFYEGHYYDPAGKKQDKNVPMAFHWWRKAAHQGQRDAQNHLQGAYSFLTRMTFLFREDDGSTRVTYYYTLSQDKERLIDLFFNLDNFLSFDRSGELIKNRLLISLFVEDDLIEFADKKTLLENIIEKKFKTPSSFVACLPTDPTQRRALAEVLETISKPSISHIIQTALASLVGIQPALRRAEQQLQDFYNAQSKDQVDKVKQDLQSAKRVNYTGKPEAMLVYTLLQLQNLIAEFRENVLDSAQPMVNHDAKNLQTFNKVFCLIIQNQRVKGNLTKAAHERLLAIYKDLCQSEIQLQQDQEQLTEIESFDQALELRLFALWIGACALASGHVMRQLTRKEILKREIFHMGAALCHIVPGLSVIPEFLDASAEIIETLHKATEISHVGLMVASAGYFRHTGLEIYNHKQTPDQKLINFYRNLGRQGESLIGSLVDALKQRFQPILKDLIPQDAAKFGDAMAEHIAEYLMSKPLSKTERKNLVSNLIYRCSYYPINNHNFVKWHGVNISIVEITQRLSLKCSYVTVGQILSCDLIPAAIRKSKDGNRLIEHVSHQGHMLAIEEEVASFVHQLKHAQKWHLLLAANQYNVDDPRKKMPDTNQQRSRQQLLEAVEQAGHHIEDAAAKFPLQSFQQDGSPIIFDNTCIEMHIEKNPQAFKALMTIRPLMKDRMHIAEDHIALLERMAVKQGSELKAVKSELKEVRSELKRLKGENNQDHLQTRNVLNQP